MALVKNGELVDELVRRRERCRGRFRRRARHRQPRAVAGAARRACSQRGTPLGIRLHSDQPPELIAADLPHFAVVALEFPKFRDGRAYSYARLLRERYGFKGELRAVGEVLLEQLFFMLRTGFDAFEIESADPLKDYRTALADFSVWYQPAADGRPTAMQLRRGKR